MFFFCGLFKTTTTKKPTSNSNSNNIQCSALRRFKKIVVFIFINVSHNEFLVCCNKNSHLLQDLWSLLCIWKLWRWSWIEAQVEKQCQYQCCKSFTSGFFVFCNFRLAMTEVLQRQASGAFILLLLQIKVKWAFLD